VNTLKPVCDFSFYTHGLSKYMKSYHLSLFVVGLLVVAPGYAQTVRFETSVGNFDVDLLPGYAPLNVENLLSYVTTGRYDNTVIHRAQDNFVVQMGAFSSATPEPPADTSGFSPIATDPPVEGEPAQETGLSNTVGTVALALPGSMFGTNQDGGTSSFFVNGGDNSFLDGDFTVFGTVPDMTTINAIFAAPDFPDAASQYGGGLTYSDMPLTPEGNLIMINSAYVVGQNVPEPSCGMLTILALVSVGSLGRSWRS
jgi:peptidyl-prolyl cis-trans isomerase A (cyclophilin A)